MDGRWDRGRCRFGCVRLTQGSDAAGPRDTLIRLTTSPAFRFSGTARDFFAPSEAGLVNGTGPGASTPLVVPDRADVSPPRLVFFEDGRGVAHLVDRGDMGGGSIGNGGVGEEGASRCVFGACDRDLPQAPPAAAYWDGGSVGRLMLVAGVGRQPAPCQGTGGVVALRFATRPAHLPDVGRRLVQRVAARPGCPVGVGRGPDGGVAWVVDTGEDAALYAIDVRTGATLYRSDGADAVGRARPSVTPAVVGGRVYVGAGDRIEAFGLDRPCDHAARVGRARSGDAASLFASVRIGVGSDFSGVQVAQALFNHAVQQLVTKLGRIGGQGAFWM